MRVNLVNPIVKQKQLVKEQQYLEHLHNRLATQKYYYDNYVPYSQVNFNNSGEIITGGFNLGKFLRSVPDAVFNKYIPAVRHTLLPILLPFAGPIANQLADEYIQPLSEKLWGEQGLKGKGGRKRKITKRKAIKKKAGCATCGKGGCFRCGDPINCMYHY